MPNPKLNEKINAICSECNVIWQYEFNQKEEIGTPVCSTLADLFIKTGGDTSAIEEFFKNINLRKVKSQIIAHHTADVYTKKIASPAPGADPNSQHQSAIERKLATMQTLAEQNLMPSISNIPSPLKRYRDIQHQKFKDTANKLFKPNKRKSLSDTHYETDFFQSSAFPIQKIRQPHLQEQINDENNPIKANAAYTNIAGWLTEKMLNSENNRAFKLSIMDTYRTPEEIKKLNQRGHSIAIIKNDIEYKIFDPNHGLFVLPITDDPELLNVFLAKYLETIYKNKYPVPYVFIQEFAFDQTKTHRPK